VAFNAASVLVEYFAITIERRRNHLQKSHYAGMRLIS
jgi:hypothetical protein